MKKNLLIAFALSAAVMTSCSKENFNNASESGNADAGKYAYTIKGTFASEDEASAEDSKVGIGTKDGNYFGKWEAGDQVVMYEVTSASASSRQWITDAPITVSNISTDGKTADISFNLKSPYTEDQKCRAFCYSEKVFPAGLIYGQGCLVAEQVQKGTGLENASFKDYAFIYTTSDAPVKSKVQTPSTSCKFYHALSYVDLSFNSTDFAGWKVEKIIMNKEDGTPMAATKYEVNCSRLPWPYTTETTSGTTKTASVITNVYGTKSSKITLSFSNDVILSDKTQDAWLVSLPTHMLKDTDAAGEPSQDPQKYTVIFQISKDGRTEYAKVRFNTCLKGGTIKPLGVGAITKADIMNDYKEIYDAGLDIKIGDLVVNTTTFPTATLAKPDEFTNDNDGYTKYFAGGLLFVDDITSKAVIDMSAATSNRNIATKSSGLVVVGRYANSGSQTQFNVVDMRTKYDVAFLNLRLNLKRNSDTVHPGECIFEKNSNEAVSSALRLVDCYLDVAQATSAAQHKTVAVIRDRAHSSTDTTKVAAPYSKVLVDNCMVKLSSRAGRPGEASCRLYWHMTSGTSAEPNRNVDITNNVIFTENVCLGTTAVSTIWNYTYKDAQGKNVTIPIPSYSPNLSINFSWNTVVGSGAKDGVIYYDIINGALPCKEFNANNNLAYFENCDVCGYTSAKFSQVKTSGGTTISGDNNWCGSLNTWKETAQKNQTKFQVWSVTGSNNKGGNQVDPFTTKDYVNGYFPVNRTKVTNGAGASYDTKKYCTWE